MDAELSHPADGELSHRADGELSHRADGELSHRADGELSHRASTALADAWQVHGRLREDIGGGAAELRDVRVMASGLPHPQWNSGDVHGPEPDLEAARAFYARHDAPWGVRVPSRRPWTYGGRCVASLRLMALHAADFTPAPPVAEAAVRLATAADVDAVVHVDATAFDEDAALSRAWLAPHLSAPDVVAVAMAELDGEPVGAAHALRSDGWAGPAVYLAGVGVVPAARRRGIAAALSSVLLARAFAAGVELAHLHPDTDEAARVYARLGFVELDGLDVYVDL